MTFLAIVHAPVLRTGVRLCISDLDQTPDRLPSPVSSGAEIDLRFGTCCPGFAHGAIAPCEEQADLAVLRIADAEWTIRRARSGGVAIPGLVAEDWYVVGTDAARPAAAAG